MNKIEKDSDLGKIELENLDLSVRAYNFLKKNDINTIFDLCICVEKLKKGNSQLRFGRKTFIEIEFILNEIKNQPKKFLAEYKGASSEKEFQTEELITQDLYIGKKGIESIVDEIKNQSERFLADYKDASSEEESQAEEFITQDSELGKIEIAFLDFSVRTFNFLKENGVNNILDLFQKYEDVVLLSPRRSRMEIESILDEIKNQPKKFLAHYKDASSEKEFPTEELITQDLDIEKKGIEFLDLSVRTYLFLKEKGVNNILDLFQKYEDVVLLSPRKSRMEIESILDEIKNQSERFLAYYKSRIIPKNFDGKLPNTDILSLFEHIVQDYLELLPDKRYRDKKIFIQKYYEDKTNEEIALLLGSITKERVRQLIKECLREINLLLKGEVLFCKVLPEVVVKFREFYDNLIKQKIISKDQILKQYNYKSEIYIAMLMDVFSFKSNTPTHTTFSDVKFYFTDMNITKQKLFYETAKLMYKFLKKKIGRIKEDNLVIDLRRKNSQISREYIKLVGTVFPEIEIISDSDINYYQIRFDELTSQLQVERILYEQGKTLRSDNILNILNKKLLEINPDIELVTKSSLSSAIRMNPNIKSKGKTGFYFLDSWEENSDIILDLIKKAFFTEQKPLSHEDIFILLQKKRPNLKRKSVRTITGQNFIRLIDDKFILKSWKKKYLRQIENKSRDNDTIVNRIHKLLIKNGKKMPFRDFVKLINNDKTIEVTNIYQALNNQKYFSKSFENNEQFITAIEHSNTSTTKTKKQEIIDIAKEYLKGYSDGLNLSKLVNIISKKGYKKPFIYKALNHTLIFIKKQHETYKGRKVIILKENNQINRDKEIKTIKSKIIELSDRQNAVIKKVHLSFSEIQQSLQKQNENLVTLIERKHGLLSKELDKVKIVDIESYKEILKAWLPNYNKLSTNSQGYLISAEFLYDSIQKSNGDDYAPFIHQYCRAIENEFKNLFKEYHEDIRLRKTQPEINTITTGDTGHGKFANCINKGELKYNFQEMIHILKQANSKNTPLFQDFHDFLLRNYDNLIVLDVNILQDIDFIRGDFRNPAAHPNDKKFDKTQTDSFKKDFRLILKKWINDKL